jgi:hypothetical protein
LLNFVRAQIAARALFNKLLEPNCFAITFLTPATSKTIRTAPPAITPEPSIEGRIITLQAPKVPRTLCGILKDFVIGSFIKFFRPSVFAFLKALTTSSAFATPTPTFPFSSPTTTIARKLNFLPPLVTFETRLIFINRSTNLGSCTFCGTSRILFFYLFFLNRYS